MRCSNWCGSNPRPLGLKSSTQPLSHCAPTSNRSIRIYHKCEGRIENSVLRIAVCHHLACRVMTNGDPEGRIFLSYPHTNNGFFFLLTTVFIIHFFIYIQSFIYFEISSQKSLNTLRCDFTWWRYFFVINCFISETTSYNIYKHNTLVHVYVSHTTKYEYLGFILRIKHDKMYSQYICLLPQQILIDRLLQWALYQQEKEILNNSETDSTHALFSIAMLYILSRFSKNNVWLVDIRLSKLCMFHKVASETTYEKMERGKERGRRSWERESRLSCLYIVIY